ncbi:MAG TPA: 2-hydroxyacid dehydrogenase [Oceanipulchritudo sp.]|nr:2-hydroxyacid dehydrogenase [Oceanipulchritudo sp.]
MIKVAVFDTKGYDRTFLEAQGRGVIEWTFNEFRLSAQTAFAAEGARAVCLFVNDVLDREVIRILVEMGIRHAALRCAGFNNVDLAAAREHGLSVTRVPAYSPHAVAEHAVALIMTLNRKIHRAYNRVREQNFSLGGLVGFDLAGKTVGIIGTGKIGQVAGGIFKGFGCRVIAADKFPNRDWAAQNGIAYVDLEELTRTADIISLHVPLTTETHHLINRELLETTRPGIFIVNTSRGKLIDTTALIAGLKSGHIGGVALDVYEEEEGVFFEDLSGTIIQDDELIRLIGFPNVLVTAHQAFLTREALQCIAEVTVGNLVNLCGGQDALPETGLE